MRLYGNNPNESHRSSGGRSVGLGCAARCKADYICSHARSRTHAVNGLRPVGCQRLLIRAEQRMEGAAINGQAPLRRGVGPCLQIPRGLGASGARESVPPRRAMQAAPILVRILAKSGFFAAQEPFLARISSARTARCGGPRPYLRGRFLGGAEHRDERVVKSVVKRRQRAS